MIPYPAFSWTHSASEEILQPPPLSKFNTNFTDSSPGSTAPPPLLSTNHTGLFFLKHPEPCRPTTTLLAEALGFPCLFLTFNQCLILQEDGMQFKHSFKRWAV